MRVYVDISVPRDLIDAARIDGASALRIFFRVALPLMVPGRYSLTVGLGLWSLRAQNSGNAQLFPMLVTGGLVTIIPLIALFLVPQRYWRGGMAARQHRELNLELLWPQSRFAD